MKPELLKVIIRKAVSELLREFKLLMRLMIRSLMKYQLQLSNQTYAVQPEVSEPIVYKPSQSTARSSKPISIQLSVSNSPKAKILNILKTTTLDPEKLSELRSADSSD